MLIDCKECNDKVSDKAVFCPHCGIPLKESFVRQTVRRSRMRRPNGAGTVVKLSGNRRKPYQVRVNTKIDHRGYPIFEILGSFEDRVQADIALGKYNENPYDINLRGLTFKEVYERWYTKKYGHLASDKVGARRSSEYATRAAYKKCLSLHDIIFSKIRTSQMQEILDVEDLSHASTEHVILLLKNLGKYANEYDITAKDYTSFLKINKVDDDKHGIPFTKEELTMLWNNREKPFVDTILIYCYSGWRLNELAKMPLDSIDLNDRTFAGGLKTKFSKNRIVPIHSEIFNLVENRYNHTFKSLIYHDGTSDISVGRYRKHFANALSSCGIRSEHTPNDCRHTCNTLLDNADVNRVARYRIMGHAGKDINERVYTHKSIEQLRIAVESMWVPRQSDKV